VFSYKHHYHNQHTFMMTCSALCRLYLLCHCRRFPMCTLLACTRCQYRTYSYMSWASWPTHYGLLPLSALLVFWNFLNHEDLLCHCPLLQEHPLSLSVFLKGVLLSLLVLLSCLQVVLALIEVVMNEDNWLLQLASTVKNQNKNSHAKPSKKIMTECTTN